MPTTGRAVDVKEVPTHLEAIRQTSGIRRSRLEYPAGIRGAVSRAPLVGAFPDVRYGPLLRCVRRGNRHDVDIVGPAEMMDAHLADGGPRAWAPLSAVGLEDPVVGAVGEHLEQRSVDLFA